MSAPLRSSQEVISDIASTYGVPEEIVEAIILAYIGAIYGGITGRDPDDQLRWLRLD
ncbi:MAG: hypothetical protein Q8P22_09980 [Chloroflexota bacterium]|nr:hypothetical protein [Chloroflexota bacterium]